MRGFATVVVAPMLWVMLAVGSSLAGVPGPELAVVVGALLTAGVFAVASFGHRARRDHAEET